MSKAQSPYDTLRHIPRTYDNSDSHNSALQLILALRPEWQDTVDTIEFVRFTDGITNTVRTIPARGARIPIPDVVLRHNAATQGNQ